MADKEALTVIVPTRQRADLLSYMVKDEYSWLTAMFEKGLLLFANDILELLELILDGKSWIGSPIGGQGRKGLGSRWWEIGNQPDILTIMMTGDWSGKFNVEEYKKRLSVGICRAVCAFNEQGLDVGVEAMAIPAVWSQTSSRAWVLQDTVRDNKPMTNVTMDVMQKVGAVRDKVQNLSSIADSQQGQEEHKGGDDGVKVATDVVDDEDTQLVVLKPHRELCLYMSLGTAAAVVGIMIGRPINPHVAFSGWVGYGGTVFSLDGQNCTLPTGQVRGMRKARVQHMVVGRADVEDAAKAALFTAADGDTSEELPSLKVVMITKLIDLVDDNNRSIIYGASWDKEVLDLQRPPTIDEALKKEKERLREKYLDQARQNLRMMWQNERDGKSCLLVAQNSMEDLLSHA